VLPFGLMWLGKDFIVSHCHALQEPLQLGVDSKPVKDVVASDSGRKTSTDSANVSDIVYDIYLSEVD